VIFRIEDRYEKGLATYEEVENEINERLIMPQMNAKVRTYLTTLRQEAFLEIKPGYVDSGAAPGKDTSWKDVAQLKPQTVTKEEVAAHRRRSGCSSRSRFPGPATRSRPSKPAPAAQPTQPRKRHGHSARRTPPAAAAPTKP
jgi:peptidyl-prolyl cis-trans isomerase SurA